MTVIILLFFAILTIRAQTVPEVTVDALLSHSSVPAGGQCTLYIRYAIPDKHHLTANFFELQLEEIAGFEHGLQQFSAGEFHKGEIIRKGQAVIQIPLTIGDELVPGEYELKGKASYQICREEPPETCFPPTERDFSIKLMIQAKGTDPVISTAGQAMTVKTEPADDAQKPSGTPGMTDVQRLQDNLKGNLALAFLIVFMAGIGTSLTPCVYPMIPITISYIGGRSSGKGKLKGFTLSLFYVLGLALVYAILGVVAAVTGSLFGSITQTPWVIGTVAAIFGIMGLSMLGLFDIQLPSAFQGKLQSGGPKSGFFGAVVMGMISGLVAAPCAGPVIVALMTFIASTGNIILGFTLMMTFAFGMGLLFIALGTFSGLLTSLPAADMWMEKVKKTFGVVMLGAALYIVKSLIPPPVFGFLAGMGLILLGSGIGAFRRITDEDSHGKDLIKGIGILLVAWGIYYVISLVPVPGKIIPDLAQGSAGNGQQSATLAGVEVKWLDDLASGLATAGKDKKFVLLDFGAEWCVQCKELEHKTFNDPRVIGKLQSMIAIKVDCTKANDAKVKTTLATYGVTGLPTVILLNPEGEELGRFTGFIAPEGFLGFLDQTMSSDTLE